MATTSPDGLISPEASDPYDLVSDMAAMQASTQAALANRSSKSGTESQMLNASNVRTGTLWFNTSDQRLYRYDGAGWVAVSQPPPVDESFTYEGSFSNLSNLTFVIRRFGGYGEVAGSFRLSGTWNAGEMKEIMPPGSIPSGFRPNSRRIVPAVLASTSIFRHGALEINGTDGSVTFGMSDVPPSSTSMRFDGVIKLV